MEVLCFVRIQSALGSRLGAAAGVACLCELEGRGLDRRLDPPGVTSAPLRLPSPSSETRLRCTSKDGLTRPQGMKRCKKRDQ